MSTVTHAIVQDQPELDNLFADAAEWANARAIVVEPCHQIMAQIERLVIDLANRDDEVGRIAGIVLRDAARTVGNHKCNNGREFLAASLDELHKRLMESWEEGYDQGWEKASQFRRSA